MQQRKPLENPKRRFRFIVQLDDFTPMALRAHAPQLLHLKLCLSSWTADSHVV